MEQREQPGLPSRTLSDNNRVLRVLQFNALVENSQFLLDIVYYRFFNCSPSYFLSPETLLINRQDIVFLNMTKIILLNRLRLNYPGEQYVLLQLVNMVTVAKYQYELILEATFRGCRNTFFNWAAVYRLFLHFIDPPSRLLTIPPIAYEFDYLCFGVPPSEYSFLGTYFFYHLMYCEENDCCGPLEYTAEE